MPASQRALLNRYGVPANTAQFHSNLTLWDVPAYINKRLPVIPNKIYINKDIVAPTEAAFYDLITAYDARILERKDSLITYDGCFNIRKMRKGSDKWSTHAFAIAMDFNAFRNRQGEPPTFSPRFVNIWKKHGFEWGGDWPESYIDGMHFQYNLDLLPPKQ